MFLIMARGGMVYKNIFQLVGKLFHSSFVLRVADIEYLTVELVLFIFNDLNEAFNTVVDIGEASFL